MNTLIILLIVFLSVPFAATGSLGWGESTDYFSMSGCAAYYADGKMEATAVIRGYIDKAADYGEWLAGNGYKGAVAVYRNGDKGRDVHILWPSGVIDGPYLAIDVVARHHYKLALDKNRVIDVDYSTAKEHGMNAPMAVTIIYDSSALFSLAAGSDGILWTGYTINKYEGCIGKKPYEQNKTKLYEHPCGLPPSEEEDYRPWH